MLIAAVFAVLSIDWVHTSTNLSFTRFSLPGWNLTSVGWILLALLVIIASSNAVNLTDGLDGLAAGSGTFCFGVLAIIGYWQFRHFSIYHLHAALDLGLVAVGLVGACLGFLWWNAAPARIIMGDTGSLAIGTGLGALCLLMNLDLLLPVIGGLFVAETASVIIQVISFRLFGRRVFRHGAVSPPLRDARLARVHDHRPTVDPRGPARDARSRYLLRRLLEDREGGVTMAIRQRDLRTDTRRTRVAPTPRGPSERGLFQPMPRGVASGRVLLLITTLLVTFGTIAVASASEGQSSANGGSAWSIMIHDLVYLGFGIFALYLASRVRLDRLVRSRAALDRRRSRHCSSRCGPSA